MVQVEQTEAAGSPPLVQSERFRAYGSLRWFTSNGDRAYGSFGWFAVNVQRHPEASGARTISRRGLAVVTESSDRFQKLDNAYLGLLKIAPMMAAPTASTAKSASIQPICFRRRLPLNALASSASSRS